MKLVQKPQAALRERQRNRRGPLMAANGTGSRPALPNRYGLASAPPSAQQKQLAPEPRIKGGVDGGDHTHRRQRIPAQLEKRLINTDALTTRYPGNNTGDDLLKRRWREREIATTVYPVRQGAKSSLPLTVIGIASTTMSAAGIIYAGSRDGQRMPRRGRIVPHRTGQISHEPLVTGIVFADDHDRLVHPATARPVPSAPHPIRCGTRGS